MSRQIVISDTSFSWGNFTVTLKKGMAIEVTAAMITAIGAGNLRNVAYRDQLGEHVGASNSN